MGSSQVSLASLFAPRLSVSVCLIYGAGFYRLDAFLSLSTRCQSTGGVQSVEPKRVESPVSLILSSSTNCQVCTERLSVHFCEWWMLMHWSSGHCCRERMKIKTEHVPCPRPGLGLIMIFSPSSFPSLPSLSPRKGVDSGGHVLCC